MSPPLSKRSTSIQPSATLELRNKVEELRNSGKTIIDLGLGQADYPTPKFVKEAWGTVVARGYTRYTQAAGTHEIRAAICEAMQKNFLTTPLTQGETRKAIYTPDDLVVTPGSKFLISCILMAICEPSARTEVIIPSPYWVSYPQMVKLASGVPFILQTSEEMNFKITAEQLEEAVNPNTSMLILNTPNNPTGQMYTTKELQALADVIIAEDLYVISDEIYELIVYDGNRHWSISAMGEEIRPHVILTSGLAKAYSMGGWRIGYGAFGDRELRNAVVRILSNTISSTSSIDQDAGSVVFREPQRVLAMRKDYNLRKDVLGSAMRDAGLPFLEPEGAFYIFPRISKWFGSSLNGRTIRSSLDFSEALLDEFGVASVPGIAFGSDEHVRFSFVRPVPELMVAGERITDFIKALEKGSIDFKVKQDTVRWSDVWIQSSHG